MANGRHSAPSLGHQHHSALWIPRTATAWGILGVGFLIAAVPVVLAAGSAHLSYPGCVTSCDNPARGAVFDVLAAVIALSPVPALRIYQGRRPVADRHRLAVAATVVLVPVNLALGLWSMVIG